MKLNHSKIEIDNYLHGIFIQQDTKDTLFVRHGEQLEELINALSKIKESEVKQDD